MAVSEQARLATVEEHVRGENARDMDAVMRTVRDSEQASVVYDGIPTRGHARIRRSYEIRLNALRDFRFPSIRASHSLSRYDAPISDSGYRVAMRTRERKARARVSNVNQTFVYVQSWSANVCRASI